MRIKYFCGMFVGPPKWHGTEVFEPGECDGDGVVEVDDEDWEAGTEEVFCELCGAQLLREDGHLSVAKEGG